MTFLEIFFSNYPFWAYAILFVGMFIEGEAFFLTITIFALQGHLSWPLVLLVTLAGILLGDVAWYWLGKYSRGTKLGFLLSEKFSTYHKWMEENFITRYERMAVYSKFIYFINRLTPLIAGWHGLEFKKFIKIHTYAALFWVGVMSLLVSLLAFIVGGAGLRWLLEHIEIVFVGSFVIFVVVEYSLKRIFSKKLSKKLLK